MQEKPFVLKLSVFDEGRLPFFLGGNINTTLLKKSTHEANEELKAVKRLCKDYVNKSKNVLQSTIKSTSCKTDEEKSQQSRYNALNVKYESLVNNHLQLEAQCLAKKALVEEESRNKNFDLRKTELKNNLAALEKEWIIQKEAVKRNHLQNIYECKFFDEFLNCKFLVKISSEVEVELHPGYYFTLKYIDQNKWKLIDISPKTFSVEKYSRKLESQNVQFLVASLRKRLEANWSTSEQKGGDARGILSTRVLEN